MASPDKVNNRRIKARFVPQMHGLFFPNLGKIEAGFFQGLEKRGGLFPEFGKSIVCSSLAPFVL
jgi:hypothetical protein